MLCNSAADEAGSQAPYSGHAIMEPPGLFSSALPTLQADQTTSKKPPSKPSCASLHTAADSHSTAPHRRCRAGTCAAASTRRLAASAKFWESMAAAPNSDGCM
eukprot:gnl/TRDRNA2_/TRDRNA2_40354_c1_seq1.p3 gnl/TRDRNA2_/TRDRNA2_40354_c1~~gnl/TRDRNA2_/TRDRNA2_40354_c1_seq1.p3  ORF type:complete len:103 (+),score=17.78 gnl/TRDRNA2_/TRDRNA2_40354_c1_seq1:158-466(+)